MTERRRSVTFIGRLAQVPKRHFVAAAVIGLLSGIGATGFHFLADRLGEVLFRWVESNGAPMRFPLVVLVPSLGLLFVGFILQRYPPGRLGGVREVFESLGEHEGLIPWNRIVNVILSGLVLAFGGSVGPEGPMVQMGALIGSQAGRRFVTSTMALRSMVRAGAAAGIAAAFRSPAGGILLTVELFGARFDTELAVIGVASVVGYLTRTALLGRDYPFALPSGTEPLPLAGILVVAPLMGLLAAPAGHLFIRLLDATRRVFRFKAPLSLKVGLGGLLVGCIGLFYPHVMSAGYAVVVHGIRDGYSVQMFSLLFLLKIVATSITFGSGAVGGLFAPTLFMGAMFGGAFGYGVQILHPAAAPQPEVYVVLGMVAIFSSIVKGYWSGLLLVADMSGAYHAILLPGIIAGGISFVLSWAFHDRSVFDLPQGGA